MTTISAESVALESAIDRIGVVGVVQEMREICHAKADHLRSNWQDEASAREFEKVAGLLDKLVGRLMKLA